MGRVQRYLLTINPFVNFKRWALWQVIFWCAYISANILWYA
jgi:hypothetical protein